MRKKVTTIATACALVAGSVLLLTSPAGAARTCFGRPATIVGKNTNPNRAVELKGTSGDDVIVGLAGWDLIEGFGGDDLICGGGGDDHVDAGRGNDKARGQGGMDTLNGKAGRDHLWGGGNSDSLAGGVGHDRIFGGRASNDSLVGGAGSDYIHGGRGYDMAEFWDSPDGVTADLRTDEATGFGSDRIPAIEGLVGSSHDDLLYGDERSNHIRGGPGDDEIYAFGSSLDPGADILRSDGGTDLLDAGEGPDTVSYHLSPFSVDANLATGEAISAGGFGHDTLVGVENLTGSKYDDTIVGDDGDNRIIGDWGDDTLDGGGGVDEIAFFDSRDPVIADLTAGTSSAGASGSDIFVGFENISGSAYPDTLTGDDGPNEIWGADGHDSLEGLGGNDIVLGGRGFDEGDGGDGTDGCDTEVEVACETDPAASATLLRRWRSGL